jgi:hypothetical protein
LVSQESVISDASDDEVEDMNLKYDTYNRVDAGKTPTSLSLALISKHHNTAKLSPTLLMVLSAAECGFTVGKIGYQYRQSYPSQ